MRLTANCSAPSTQKKDEYNNQFVINLPADRRSSDFQLKKDFSKNLKATESEIVLSNFA